VNNCYTDEQLARGKACVTFCHGRVGNGRDREGRAGNQRRVSAGIPERGFDSRPSHGSSLLGTKVVRG
jgi:hypothetical protein